MATKKPEHNDDWTEYRRLVLAELERLNDENEKRAKEIEEMREKDRLRDITQASATAKLAAYVGVGSLLGGALLSYLFEHYIFK